MGLVDAYGREFTDHRVSVTKRCNFSSVYCHNEGLGRIARPGDPHSEEMEPEFIERIVRVASRLGVATLHLTGGEPLVRPDLEEIIERSRRHIPQISLTTNGSMLARRASTLKEAGLKRVNVSMDAVHPEAFREIRGSDIAPVLQGIERALDLGLVPLKINMVVMRQTLPYIPQMLDYVGRREGMVLQLIQFMPELVGHSDWMVDIDAVKRWLSRHSSKITVREHHRRRVYQLNGASVELVDPVYNREFCFNCHRVRVTHDGKLKGCLNRDDDLIDIRGLTDEGVRKGFETVVANRVPYYGVHIRDFPDREAADTATVPDPVAT